MDFTQISTWYPMFAGTAAILLVLGVIWGMMRSVERARRRDWASSIKVGKSRKRATAAQRAARVKYRQDEWVEIARLHRSRALILIAALGLLAIEVLVASILLIEKTPFIIVSTALVIGYLGVVKLLLRPLPEPGEDESPR